ncbi:regulatory prophage protein [Ruegeria sp. TrichCH4B]|nr:regulatory prophage protein [Ruegeria sp. TrichCH4B]
MSNFVPELSRAVKFVLKCIAALDAYEVSALDDPEFWVIAAPVTFAGKASDAGSMVEMVQHLASQTGRFDLIVVDTLSRVMGDGDENTAPDIADLVKNLDVLRRRTGSNIMLIHHSGKDIARGARGHSSLRAAVDTEIELICR